MNKPQPIKTIRDRRLAYLDSLADSYEQMGYVVHVDGKCNILEVYKPGTVLPRPEAEAAPLFSDVVIEKWVN